MALYKSQHTKHARILAFIFSAVLAFAPFICSHAVADTRTQEQTRYYQIPAGSLATALGQFAAEAKIILTANAELTDGLSSPGLNGQYSVSDALKQLLASTDLVMRFTGKASVIIESAVQGGAMALPPVKVSGTGLNTQTLQ